MCPEPHWQHTFLLLTCEHGGREVPAAYAHLFRDAAARLQSHRGSDIGALGVAQRMAARLAAPLVYTTTTRLLVDVNRSVGQPDLFSELTRDLSAAERDTIVAAYHAPHRAAVETLVRPLVTAGHAVLHLGVHSCVDVLNGSERHLDVALLFDPERESEVSVSARMRDELLRRAPHLRSPFNEPYRGSDDGLTTTLRTRFPPDRYAGIEIEIRQGLVTTEAGQRTIADLLAETVAALAPDVA